MFKSANLAYFTTFEIISIGSGKRRERKYFGDKKDKKFTFKKKRKNIGSHNFTLIKIEEGFCFEFKITAHYLTME